MKSWGYVQEVSNLSALGVETHLTRPHYVKSHGRGAQRGTPCPPRHMNTRANTPVKTTMECSIRSDSLHVVYVNRSFFGSRLVVGARFGAEPPNVERFDTQQYRQPSVSFSVSRTVDNQQRSGLPTSKLLLAWRHYQAHAVLRHVPTGELKC